MSNPGWRWPYPTDWCRSASFTGVRHWVLIEREVRPGSLETVGRAVAKGGAKEGVKMTTTTLVGMPGIIIYHRRARNILKLDIYPLEDNIQPSSL